MNETLRNKLAMLDRERFIFERTPRRHPEFWKRQDRVIELTAECNYLIKEDKKWQASK